MRFRQVHLDFHTSEAITNIGENFDKKQFQAMLKKGHLDSITVFSKCHHGWAYHPSEKNEIHPHLSFDLLGAMIDAAHEIDVKTPVYLSAGIDEKLARIHPEWLIRDEEDKTSWIDSFMKPGYHQFCMNSPYLDILLEQIDEVIRNYDVDGLFLDIVGVRECYCHNCVNDFRAKGNKLNDSKAWLTFWEQTYANYTERVRNTIDAVKPGLPVFHNGGHLRRGRRDLATMNSHLELESLPTGGWGYDHFPLSASYAQQLGMNYLGMTGKFHTSWGEFGGYKHPNALRYETALSIAHGARCSVGDQLHPNGLMDELTYELIGQAYSEIEKKEAWCTDIKNIADIALLSVEAVLGQEEHTGTSDTGAIRMLLEGNYLFDVIDLESDFQKYKVLILPDHIIVSEPLREKLNMFINKGGKLLCTGISGLNVEQTEFAVDLGVTYLGYSPYNPEYFHPDFELNSLSTASFIFYSQGQLVKLNPGNSILGQREFPYFNREPFTFCSHLHTPSSLENSGPGMVESVNGIYIAWNIFEDYALKGSLALKETVLYALDRLLAKEKTVQTNLPAQGIVTLHEQKKEQRYVNHILYATPVKRGKDIEIIEDIIPIYDTQVTVKLSTPITKVYLAPQKVDLPFETDAQGRVSYTVSKIDCHQMVVLEE